MRELTREDRAWLVGDSLLTCCGERVLEEYGGWELLGLGLMAVADVLAERGVDSALLDEFRHRVFELAEGE